MRGFFIDVQGTLIDDVNFLPLPGSVEFLEYLNENSVPFVLITNNTKRSSGEFKNYLKELGFKFRYYIDPLCVVKEYVNGKKIAAYGNENFLKTLKELGLEFDHEKPDTVVTGIKLYSNEELSEIIEFLLNGAQLAGMHKTSLYYLNGKRYPGLGAVLELLKYATGKEYVTVGKPSESFFERARKYLGLNYDKITIISDDLIGDLLPAQKLGMHTILVLSGKIKSSDEAVNGADKIFANVGEILEYWRKNGKKTT